MVWELLMQEIFCQREKLHFWDLGAGTASLILLHMTLVQITLLADYLDGILPSCLCSTLNTNGATNTESW